MALNVAAVSAFTEDRLRNLVVWRRKSVRLAPHICSDLPHSLGYTGVGDNPARSWPMHTRASDLTKCPGCLPGDPPGLFPSLAEVVPMVLRASVVMLSWLFRRSFASFYGQTRTERVVARILTGSRSNVESASGSSNRVECTRHKYRIRSEMLDERNCWMSLGIQCGSGSPRIAARRWHRDEHSK